MPENQPGISNPKSYDPRSEHTTSDFDAKKGEKRIRGDLPDFWLLAEVDDVETWLRIEF